MPRVPPPRSSKHPIKPQQLLYPQRTQRNMDKDPPSYAAAQRSSSQTMPIPRLIDELFDISISTLNKLSGSKRGEPKLMVQRNASWWCGNIQVYRIYYTEVEDGVCIKDVMERGGYDKLYAEMFWYLAEAIFHAYKVIRSVRDASNFKTSSNYNHEAWQHLQQDGDLWAEVGQGMTLVRAHTTQLNFSLAGYDLWLENKTEEDYSVLYYDEAYIGRAFVTMEDAARGDAFRMAGKMSAVDKEFRMLRLRIRHSSPREEQLPAYEESKSH